jgi:hypothetical protein
LSPRFILEYIAASIFNVAQPKRPLVSELFYNFLPNKRVIIARAQ